MPLSSVKTQPIVAIRAALVADGYAYIPTFAADCTGLALVALARALGSLYVPPGLDAGHPVLDTHPAADASPLAPFDRPEGIGWHNDFSTHADRPRVSLAYLAHADPRGPDHGAWRVASCDRVLEELGATRKGRQAVRFLREVDLPFSFTDETQPCFFRVLEHRGGPGGRLALRFYGRALRDGARLVHGAIPDEIEHTIATVEVAADRVGHTLAAPAGALLVTDNWHSLHDRLPQSVDLRPPLRHSQLCFVHALHAPVMEPVASQAP